MPVTDFASAMVTVASLSCSLGSSTDQIEEYASGSSRPFFSYEAWSEARVHGVGSAVIAPQCQGYRLIKGQAPRPIRLQ
jgi:hypothetical protein